MYPGLYLALGLVPLVASAALLFASSEGLF